MGTLRQNLVYRFPVALWFVRQTWNSFDIILIAFSVFLFFFSLFLFPFNILLFSFFAFHNIHFLIYIAKPYFSVHFSFISFSYFDFFYFNLNTSPFIFFFCLVPFHPQSLWFLDSVWSAGADRKIRNTEEKDTSMTTLFITLEMTVDNTFTKHACLKWYRFPTSVCSSQCHCQHKTAVLNPGLILTSTWNVWPWTRTSPSVNSSIWIKFEK